MRGQRHGPAALYLRERPGTHCTGGWVGPKAVLNRCRKSRPHWDSNPETVQPIASRYTDYATVCETGVKPRTVQPVASRYTDYATVCETGVKQLTLPPPPSRALLQANDPQTVYRAPLPFHRTLSVIPPADFFYNETIKYTFIIK